MYTVLVVVQVVVAIALVGVVLVQHGKGADAGAAFGSGSAGTVFGARGAANFLTRSTAWLAFAFFVISLALAYMVSNRSQPESLVDRLASEQPEVPAGPVVPDEDAQAEVGAAGAAETAASRSADEATDEAKDGVAEPTAEPPAEPVIPE
jgi:preprotein translocase subunit SecG